MGPPVPPPPAFPLSGMPDAGGGCGFGGGGWGRPGGPCGAPGAPMGGPPGVLPVGPCPLPTPRGPCGGKGGPPLEGMRPDTFASAKSCFAAKGNAKGQPPSGAVILPPGRQPQAPVPDSWAPQTPAAPAPQDGAPYGQRDGAPYGGGPPPGASGLRPSQVRGPSMEAPPQMSWMAQTAPGGFGMPGGPQPCGNMPPPMNSTFPGPAAAPQWTVPKAGGEPPPMAALPTPAPQWTMPGTGGEPPPPSASAPAPLPGLAPPLAPPGAAAAAPPAVPGEQQLGPPRLVLLAPATASITPVSSKPRGNKEIAMQFVNADKETQTRMLRDPSVARAILQTLAESPQQPGSTVPQMVSQLGRSLGGTAAAAAPAPGAAPVPAAAPAPAPAAQAGAGGAPPVSGGSWSGSIILARNMGKRMQLRASMVHGKAQDVEVALRSAAQNSGTLDITHRVPFEEIARRSNGTVLALTPPTPAEQPQFDEYVKYFRTKMRAGVARLDGALALYVLPPAEDVPAIRDSVYALGAHVPRSGCLLGLIAPGTTAAPAPVAATAGKQTAEKGATATPAATAAVAPAGGAAAAGGRAAAAAARPAPAAADGAAAAPAAGQAAAAATGPAGGTAAVAAGKAESGTNAPEEDGAGDGGLPVSSKELLDLFSNPELIKLLSDEGENKGS